MTEWISVTDRLPEKRGIYWVCYQINGRLKTHYSLWEEKSGKYKGTKWGWRSRELVRRSNIIYWMPLPAPPDRLIESDLQELQ
jgi:hypothetical protein